MRSGRRSAVALLPPTSAGAPAPARSRRPSSANSKLGVDNRGAGGGFWRRGAADRPGLRGGQHKHQPEEHVMPRHFGVLVPSTNTTCEIEFCRLAPELQVHTARLGKDGHTPFHPSLAADVAYQAKLLGHARVEVIALAQTS